MSKQKQIIMIGAIGLAAFVFLRPQSANAADVVPMQSDPLQLGLGGGGGGGGGGGSFSQLLAQSLASSDAQPFDNNAVATQPTPTKSPTPAGSGPKLQPAPTPRTLPGQRIFDVLARRIGANTDAANRDTSRVDLR